MISELRLINILACSFPQYYDDVSIGKSIIVSNDKSDGELWDIHPLTHLQANIDDATAELLAYVIEILLKNGAVDAWVHPIVMKKGRPANSLHCICRCDTEKASEEYVHGNLNEEDKSAENKLLNIMFRHTTTLGIRIQRNIQRAALQRRFVRIQTPYSDELIDVKISSLKNGEVVSVKAEFEQCKTVAEDSCIPYKTVASAAERIAWDNNVTSESGACKG